MFLVVNNYIRLLSHIITNQKKWFDLYGKSMQVYALIKSLKSLKRSINYLLDQNYP